MLEAVSARFHSMRDCVFAEVGGEELRSRRHTPLPVEEEFDVTLTAHLAVNVTFNL